MLTEQRLIPLTQQTTIKASETEAAAVKTTMNKGGNNKNKDKSKKALKFLDSRLAGRIRGAKSKGMKGFVKRNFRREDRTKQQTHK